MLGAIALLAIVGIAASQDACCSIEDRREVAAMWNEIWSSQYTGRRVKLALAVFQNIFEKYPESKSLFTRVGVEDVYSAEFRAHCVRVVNGLDECINLLHDPATLNAEMEHLAAQHVARKGVTQTHFNAMHDAFLDVMPQVSSCFNSDAWSRCFKHVAYGISSDLPQ